MKSEIKNLQEQEQLSKNDHTHELIGIHLQTLKSERKENPTKAYKK